MIARKKGEIKFKIMEILLFLRQKGRNQMNERDGGYKRTPAILGRKITEAEKKPEHRWR